MTGSKTLLTLIIAPDFLKASHKEAAAVRTLFLP